MKSSVLNFGWGRFLPLLILISCASKTEKEFNSLITAGKCEEATLHVPQFKVEKKIEEGMTYTSTGASYILTTAAYGVDVVYYISAGVALPVVACMPAMFVSNPEAVIAPTPINKTSEKCFEAVHNFAVKYDSYGNPKTFGSKLYKKTAEWRCPNFDFAVENLVKISDCYRAQGNFAKARLQLNNILDEETFGGCVSDDLRDELNEKLDSIH